MYDNTCGRFKGIPKKVLLALLAAGTMAFGAVGVAAEEAEIEIAGTVDAEPAVTAYAGGMSLAELQAKFPEGRYWNGGDADLTTDTACTCHGQGICIDDIDPCNCNHFDGGTQCNGFARKLAYDAYGSYVGEWETSTSAEYVDSLKPGDVVYNDSPHWFMVIADNGDSVTVCECNWGSRCVIGWSRVVEKSVIEGYSGLKIFIAPYSLTEGAGEAPVETEAVETEAPEEEGDRVLTIGTCGANAMFTLDRDGDLCISGTGAMPDWASAAKVPWHDYADEIKRVVVMDGVTYIGSYAFANCANITSVEIADSVTAIEKYAFSNCDSLTSIVMPDSVTYIASYAFFGCDDLGEVVISESATYLGAYSFSECVSLKSVYIPASVTGIRTCAFSKCISLESVIMADGVTTIGESAFNGCIDLVELEFSENLTIIGANAFMNCTQLSGVTLPESLSSLGASAFEWCVSLTDITIPGDVETIGKRAFFTCTSLQDVTLSPGVLTIGEAAFCGCYALSSITIPDSVTAINSNAFFDCKSLGNLIIPNSVIAIGKQAFMNCIALKELVLPASVTTIDDGAFNGCVGLTSVTFSEGLKTIHENAFINCIGLTNVVIPESVNAIHRVAFTGCTGLIHVTVLGRNTSFGEGVFFAPPITNLTIYGYANSTSDTYAAANKHNFVALDKPTNPDASCTMGSTSADTVLRVGDIVEVSLVLENDKIINSIALFDLSYDTTALTFLGFTDYEEIETLCEFPGGFDDANGAVTLALKEDQALSGYICKLRFLVNAAAAEGDYIIEMSSIIKRDSTVLVTRVNEAEVTVTHQIKGDVNVDGIVDITDAAALFRHSMLPQIYTVDYLGMLDFNRDGTVDINDARLLFRYSMLPDIYPIA